MDLNKKVSIAFLQTNLYLADNQQYYSGTAQHWIENIASGFCSKSEFVLADLICFNYSIYGNSVIDERLWFPLTYVYDYEYESVLSCIGKKLISREFVDDIMPLFCHDSLEKFVAEFKKVEGSRKDTYRDYRYRESFVSAQILSDYIKSDQIASMR